MSFPSGAFHRGQQGAALLAFMLVIIVAAATMLVSRLNEHAQTYARNTATQLALDQAKRALLSYAMNYPELRNAAEKGPGFLPCPAQNSTGDPTSCGNAATTFMRLGKLPYAILGLNDLRDSSGEQLWYAVSDNFKNTLSNAAILNSDTPGLISVDATADIVAVVVAPGTPVAGQGARPSLNPADYLEGGNEIAANGTFVSTSGGEFNDRLVTITRAELAGSVEARVVSEVRALFANYRANPNHGNGRYPWLAPFADPKSGFNTLRGTHSGSGNSASLTDSGQDFYEWRVQAGDIVRNITDGSVATVATTPTSSTNTLSLNTPLFGTDNDFDAGDQYVVNVSQLGGRLRSTATAGSSGTTLADSARDFVKLGVTPGDVIDNLTSGASAVVQTVTANQITVRSGGATFANGHSYAIRSNYGRATGGSSTTLVDTNKNFTTMGIRSGDLVVNLTDGSVGRVASVAGATTLNLSAVYLGTNNAFAANDYYYIPRFNTDVATRRGMLSVHERGEAFKTAFNLDWSLLQSNGITITTTPTPGTAVPQTDYTTRARLDAETSSSTYSFSSDEAVCVWMNEDFVECNGGKQVDPVSTSGVVTSGTNTSTVTDSTQTFQTKRVRTGDIIQNFNDETDLVTRTSDAGSSGTTLYDVGANFTSYDTAGPYELIVLNNATGVQGVVTKIVDNNTLIAEGYTGSPAISFSAGQSFTLRRPQYMVVSAAPSSQTTLTTKSLSGTAPDFDSGEYYRIVSAAHSISGSIDAVSGSTWMRDTSRNFGNDGVEPGDIVEAGNTGNRSYGIITTVAGSWIEATLYSGSSNTFNTWPYTYKIYHGYVSKRDLRFRIRFRAGTASPRGKSVYASGGVRKRSGCIGYGTDCSAITTAGSVPYNFGTPVITITDYEDDGNVVATTTATIPSTGSPTGNIRVSNMDYFLAEGSGEIPDWFVHNKWHQYVYAAFSSGYQPGAGGSCTAGTTCLRLATPYAGTQNDRHAIVMTAGRELATQNRAVSVVTETEYLEGDNVLGGTHTGAGNSANLTDSSRNFVAAGVQVGNTVRNFTDGSVASVNAVAANTLTLSALSQGIDNDFDVGDKYTVYNEGFRKDLVTATFNDQVSGVCPDAFNANCP